jgi:hypothetical protein
MLERALAAPVGSVLQPPIPKPSGIPPPPRPAAIAPIPEPTIAPAPAIHELALGVLVKGRLKLASGARPRMTDQVMAAKAAGASAFPDAREGDPALAPRVHRTANRVRARPLRPGIAEAGADDAELDAPAGSSAELKARKLAAEVKRVLAIVSPSMAIAALRYEPAEAEKLPPGTLAGELGAALAKQSVANMATGRRALLRLYDFALARACELIDFACSHVAPSSVRLGRAGVAEVRWSFRK